MKITLFITALIFPLYIFGMEPDKNENFSNDVIRSIEITLHNDIAFNITHFINDARALVCHAQVIDDKKLILKGDTVATETIAKLVLKLDKKYTSDNKGYILKDIRDKINKKISNFTTYTSVGLSGSYTLVHWTRYGDRWELGGGIEAYEENALPCKK